MLLFFCHFPQLKYIYLLSSCLGEWCHVRDRSRFQPEDTQVWHHAATQTHTTMEGGERSTFSSWKNSRYFEFLSAKDENIKVHCKLCAGDKASNTQRQIWRNLWSRSTVQCAEHQAVFSREMQQSYDSCRRSAPPKQHTLALSAEQVSEGELKKLVGRYVVEETLHVNTLTRPRLVQ